MDEFDLQATQETLHRDTIVASAGAAHRERRAAQSTTTGDRVWISPLAGIGAASPMSYIAPKSSSQYVPIAPGNYTELGGSETQAMITSLSDVDSTATYPTEPRTIPPAVWLLVVTTFAITSSEFMVAGMLPTLARAFRISIGAIGFLISLYAVGMAVGGPLVTALLLPRKVRHKRGLALLLALFLGGSLIAATAQGYTAMALGRIIQGVASTGYFGVALTICAELVAPDRRGRASSYVPAGLMLSPVAGVPTLTLIAEAAGCQAAFWTIVAITLVCIGLIATGPPPRPATRCAA